MPGGGIFDEGVQKVRPGTYINTKSERPPDIKPGITGVALLPLINFPYGPDREFFTLDTKDLNGVFDKLGFDLNYENEYTAMLRECAKNAKEIILYNVRGGIKAKATAVASEPVPADEGDSEGTETPASVPLSATARYGGTRGNDFAFAVEANPDGGYDVTVYIANETVERFENLETIEELIKAGSQFLVFEGSGPLTETAGTHLTGGEDREVTNYDISKFLDAAEAVKWNTLAFPIDGSPIEGDKEASDTLLALMRMVAAKIIYLRDQVGYYRRGVMCNYAACHEAIYNVTIGVYEENGFHLLDTDMVAWLAGADSAASKTTSLTNLTMKGVDRPDREMTNKEIEQAIQNGEFLFTLNDDNETVVEYDINSLTDFDRPRDTTYRKGRVIRTLDALRDRLRRELPPNKFDNEDRGWDLMEAIGRSVLLEFQEDRALTNVEPEEDFLVDRTASKDDYVYIDVWVQPVDSAEKIYIRLHTK